MDQPILKLPFVNKLKCSQESQSKKGRSHNDQNENTRFALDFTIDEITPFFVLASADGKVKIWRCCKHFSGNCSCGLGFGNQIRIYHNDYFTFYAHLQKILVKDGEEVKVGNLIGIAGNTGLAGTVHVHWTLGKESKDSKLIENKFIPFWSIKADKIEVKNTKVKFVFNDYFKEGEEYNSTNKANGSRQFEKS